MQTHKKIASLKANDNWQILTDKAQQAFLREEFGHIDERILAVAKHKRYRSAFALLSHMPVGYVSLAQETVDSEKLRENKENELFITNQENGFSGVSALRWKGFSPPPSLDKSIPRLRYGMEIWFGEEAALNRYQHLLTRDGAVVLTLVGNASHALNLDDFSISIDNAYLYRAYNPARDAQLEGDITNLLLMTPFI